MRYDWSISLSGPLNSKICFDRQNVSGRKLWNTFKGKVRKWTKRTKLRSRYPRLSSWILRDFGGKQATNGEDEHDEDNSTRELDDFIATERSSNTKRKNRKRRNTSGKCFEGFANSRQMLLSTSKFLKMSPRKKLSASTTQTVFQALKKACSSSPCLACLARLSLFAARLTSKALQGRFGSKTTPHPSFFASTNIGSISNNVFNLVQSTWKFPLKRRETPKNRILLVEKILVLFSIALIKFIYSFIYLLRTLNKVSRSHILRRNTLHCAL